MITKTAPPTDAERLCMRRLNQMVAGKKELTTEDYLDLALVAEQWGFPRVAEELLQCALDCVEVPVLLI